MIPRFEVGDFVRWSLDEEEGYSIGTRCWRDDEWRYDISNKKGNGYNIEENELEPVESRGQWDKENL